MPERSVHRAHAAELPAERLQQHDRRGRRCVVGAGDDRVDGAVGELVDEAEAVVAAQLHRVVAVDHRLERGVGHRLHGVDDGVQRAQRGDVLGAAVGRAGVEDQHADRGPPLQLERDHRQRRGAHQHEAAAQRVGRLAHQVAVGAHHLARRARAATPSSRRARSARPAAGRTRTRPRCRSCRRRRACAQNRSGFSVSEAVTITRLGGEHARGAQVVGRQAHLALEPAAARADREAGDAGGRHATAGDREAVLLRGGVELAPQHAGLDPGDPAPGVDVDRLQRAEVDDQAAFGGREPGRGVRAGADRDLEVVGAARRRAPRRRRGPSRTARSAPAAGRSSGCGRGVRSRSLVVGGDQGAGEARDRRCGAGEQERHGSHGRRAGAVRRIGGSLVLQGSANCGIEGDGSAAARIRGAFRSL